MKAPNTTPEEILAFQKNLAKKEAQHIPVGTPLPDSFGIPEISDALATEMQQFLAQIQAALQEAPNDESRLRLLKQRIHQLNIFAEIPDHSDTIRWGVRRTRDRVLNLLNETWLQKHQPHHPFTENYVSALQKLNEKPLSLLNRLHCLLLLLGINATIFSQHILGLSNVTVLNTIKGKTRGITQKTHERLAATFPESWLYFLFEGGSLPLDPGLYKEMKKRPPLSRSEQKLRARCEADTTRIGHRLGLLISQTRLGHDKFGELLGGSNQSHVSKMIYRQPDLSTEMLRRFHIILSAEAYAYLVEGIGIPAEDMPILSGKCVKLEEFPRFSKERFEALATKSGLDQLTFNQLVRERLLRAFPGEDPKHIKSFHTRLAHGAGPTIVRLRSALTPAAFDYMIGNTEALPAPDEILIPLESESLYPDHMGERFRLIMEEVFLLNPEQFLRQLQAGSAHQRSTWTRGRLNERFGYVRFTSRLKALMRQHFTPAACAFMFLESDTLPNRDQIFC